MFNLGRKVCYGCKKLKWGVKHQTIMLPIGQKATLKQEEICNSCAKKVEKATHLTRDWGKQKQWK